MSAGSLKYVINHLIEGNDAPVNQHQERFLKWITQICITMWVYRCEKADWGELKQSVSRSILSAEFTPSENDAAYLTIIAFVLGEEYDHMLAEYIDAVVWNSKVEFSCKIEPLQNIISRERKASVEFMYSTFSGVLHDLAYSDNRTLLTLGQRLNGHLRRLGVDLRRPYAGTQDFNQVQYPAAFETTFLEALREEQEALGLRYNARAVNGADVQHWNPVPRRFGNGEAVVAAIANLFIGNKHQATRIQLENILRDAMKAIEERRRQTLIAVEELKEAREERNHRDASNGGNASLGQGFHDDDELAHHGANGAAEI
ncbi:hypothetical protein CLAIMM_08104 [Cladophialophora immunda]|nr:hypothetical protein CLAIMM_08104 [Cladophialophora immunda]